MSMGDNVTSYITTPSAVPLTKVLMLELSGLPSHAVEVAEAIGVGYGIDNSGAKSNYTLNGVTYSTSLNIYNWIIARVVFINGGTLDAALLYAYNNKIRLLVNSDSILDSSALASAKRYYDYVQCVIPDFRADFVEATPWSPDVEQCIVVTGSSVADPNNNGTSYANALSFFDTYNTASSFSNGLIAGKLLYIKEQQTLAAGHETAWFQARYAAQQTASGGGVKTLTNGWGKISVTAALAYAGSYIPDPYFGL